MSLPPFNNLVKQQEIRKADPSPDTASLTATCFNPTNIASHPPSQNTANVDVGISDTSPATALSSRKKSIIQKKEPLLRKKKDCSTQSIHSTTSKREQMIDAFKNNIQKNGIWMNEDNDYIKFIESTPLKQLKKYAKSVIPEEQTVEKYKSIEILKEMITQVYMNKNDAILDFTEFHSQQDLLDKLNQTSRYGSLTNLSSIDAYLEMTNHESPAQQLISLQAFGQILAKRLNEDPLISTSENLTEKIKRWNKTLISSFSKRLPHLNKKEQAKHTNQLINLLKSANKSNLFQEKFISYVQILKIIQTTYEHTTNAEIPIKDRKDLESVLLSLCRTTQKFNAHSIETLKAFRVALNLIYLKTLHELTKYAPTEELISLLADLIKDEPKQDLVFLFTRIFANFHETIDFGDASSLKNCIQKIPDQEIQEVLSDYANSNLESIQNRESQNPIVLWLKSMIAHCHNLDFDLAEQLLKQAMEFDPGMGLHLALLYFQRWDKPESDQLKHIRDALAVAQPAEDGIDRALWNQCNSKSVELDILNSHTPERQIAPGDEKKYSIASGEGPTKKHETENSKAEKKASSFLPEHHTDKHTGSVISVCGAKGAIKRTEGSPDYRLTSAIKLIRQLIELYQWHPHPVGTLSETDSSDFLVSTKNGQAVPQLQWIHLGLQNPLITKILIRINICRVLNDLEGEINVYTLLKNPKFRWSVPFDRLLEEAVWTLLHCTEDHHNGGFSTNKKERIEALGMAKQLIIICLQHTVRNSVLITEDTPLPELISRLTDWLNKEDNFGNEPKLQQYMRRNIRCRAGSTLGHIFQFLQEETGSEPLGKKASMCFGAKTTFDPGYKPIEKENRQSYYRKAALAIIRQTDQMVKSTSFSHKEQPVDLQTYLLTADYFTPKKRQLLRHQVP